MKIPFFRASLVVAAVGVHQLAAANTLRGERTREMDAPHLVVDLPSDD